jgi:hypothetical protein
MEEQQKSLGKLYNEFRVICSNFCITSYYDMRGTFLERYKYELGSIIIALSTKEETGIDDLNTKKTLLLLVCQALLLLRRSQVHLYHCERARKGRKALRLWRRQIDLLARCEYQLDLAAHFWESVRREKGTCL